MKKYIEETYKRVELQEGQRVIEQFLIQCYLNPDISTKELARKVLLPLPVATAIKKELIKAGALEQGSGVRCSANGREYVKQALGYGGLDHVLFQKLISEDDSWRTELADVRTSMEEIFSSRPQVDVLLDQSKSTVETSLRRALLCLRDQALLGKRILCVGDDDLVSVALGLLLKRLYPAAEKQAAMIDVVDIDQRFLGYIESIAAEQKLPITCHQADLRQPLPKRLHGKYDCFFTDPPYTLSGMSLFLSRGISGLQKQKGLSIYLSFAHKSPDFTLAMQREFVRAGLTVREVISHFNEYEGAQMIGNRGQMIVLTTTEMTEPSIPQAFHDALYTGEEKQTLRTYRCKRCDEAVRVGVKGAFKTIEELKKRGCPRCKNGTFRLISRKRV